MSNTNTGNMIEQFLSARRAGVSLISISTPDPPATIQTIRAASNIKTPLVQWDCVTGWRSLEGNEPGARAIRDALSATDAQVEETILPDKMLQLAASLPGFTPDSNGGIPGSVLFVHNAQRQFTEDAAGACFVQALSNLRDSFKEQGSTVVLLGPTVKLPPELSSDVLALDEPLPGEDELSQIIMSVAESARIVESVTEDVRARATDALRGLAAFPAEQVVAMSASPEGLDIGSLWERKRQMIEACEGLSVFREGTRFADLGGLSQAKAFFARVATSREAPRVIVFIDEIEKAMAGATSGTSDSSGVSQGFAGTLLSYLQDTKATGALLVGPAGAGKSIMAKTLGNEVGVPTITLDLSGMKDSLVGASEARLRQALKIISAVGGGRSLWVATSNDISVLKPELKARFRLGVWYFDIPDAEERDAIWRIYCEKYEIDSAQRATVDDTGWVGREIENCCYMAWNLNMTLAEAAAFIVPVIKADPAGVDRLRREADKRYLSASYAGTYQYRAEETATKQKAAAGGKRSMNVNV